MEQKMKQLKFRIWGNISKKWINPREVEIDGIGVVFVNGVSSEDCIIMQFTGFKDKKNNKEIYEGDIVKHQNGFTYVVEFSEINGWWCLVQPRKKDGNVLEKVYTGGINGQDIWRCEVIGNIYENSELLENKNETEK
jgi:uncharacterized phage protein (TIGR01671 family)